jgi:hypothetical protein
MVAPFPRGITGGLHHGRAPRRMDCQHLYTGESRGRSNGASHSLRDIMEFQVEKNGWNIAGELRKK